jgi:hypothetical protein
MINPPVNPPDYLSQLQQGIQQLQGMGFPRNISRAALARTSTGDWHAHTQMINIQAAIDALHTWQANGSPITLYLNVSDRRNNGHGIIGGMAVMEVTPNTTINDVIAWKHNMWPLPDDAHMHIRWNGQRLQNGDTITSTHLIDLQNTRDIHWPRDRAGDPPKIPSLNFGIAVEAFHQITPSPEPPPATPELTTTPIGGKRKGRKGRKSRKSRKGRKSRKSKKSKKSRK